MEYSSEAIWQITQARNFISRAAGLLFRKRLNKNECLLITPCNSVHTIGMRYALDIVFIDAFGLVTDVYLNVPPFKIIHGSKKSCSVVEFLGGSLSCNQLKMGQALFIPL